MARLFTQPSFLANSNIYEVNVRQYTAEGTFKAFENHLPRLKDMGVEILWMMPIHPIGLIKRKGTLGSYYSIQNHKGINPEFGSEDDFRDLIMKVHWLGMKIIIDWVANHTSWDNVWTDTNPDFFARDSNGEFVSPYDWSDVIQIDHTNAGEQTAMIDAMKYWITEFNIDGFRADLAHLTPLPFWLKARLQLSAFKKDLIWLAETEEINYHEAFDISYTWKWMHITEEFAKGKKTLAECILVLHEYKRDFENKDLRMFYTSNHDENTWNGTEYDKYGSFAKAWAVFSMLYFSVPLIYTGQEIPNLRRLQFFEKDHLQWAENSELHEFYKTLLSLRKTNKVFKSLKIEDISIDESLIAKNILLMSLKNEDAVVICILNLNHSTIRETVNLYIPEGLYLDVFTTQTTTIRNHFHFEKDAGGFCIMEKM